jgi:hypothetical protein
MLPDLYDDVQYLVSPARVDIKAREGERGGEARRTTRKMNSEETSRPLKVGLKETISALALPAWSTSTSALVLGQPNRW